ncbi:MAG: glycosyltransferase [Rhodothermales bacterium]
MTIRPPVPSDRELPSVSVIVPIYNASGVLQTTLPSWLSQDTSAEWLLVDDGSSDDTAELLSSMAGATMQVLRHSRNRGRAAARNTGIAAATGEVLLFLDADMRPEPDFVRQHAIAHSDPDVIGVVSNPILEDLDLANPYHRYLRSRRGAAGVGPGKPLPFRYFIIGYTSVKAAAVAAVGGFDEQFSYGEDLDFAYRLAQRYPDALRFSDRPVVHHYDHGDLDGRLRKLREFGRDNLPALLAKHPGLAAAAKVDFVDSPSQPRSWEASLKRWALKPGLVAPLRRLLPYAPPPMSDVVIRYVLAASIAEAFRNSVSPS